MPQVLNQLCSIIFVSDKHYRYLFNCLIFSEQPIPLMKNSWSLVEPQCRHTLIPDDAASMYPVRFLDVGDSFKFSVTAAITDPGKQQKNDTQQLPTYSWVMHFDYNTGSKYPVRFPDVGDSLKLGDGPCYPPQ